MGIKPPRPKFNHAIVRICYAFTTALAVAATCLTTPARAEIDPSLGYVKKVLKRILSHEKVQVNNQENTQKAIKGAFKIVQYLNPGDPTVVISAGRNQGIVDGATLYSYRQNDNPIGREKQVWIKTGKLKALHVDKDFTFARVIEPGNALSKAFFPRNPDSMAGDTVKEARYRIVKNPMMTPTKSIVYKDLFEDPMSDPVSFELTEDGKSKLRSLADSYKKLHIPFLMVEAYTDPTGPSDANQVESYQRALTIRHFLVDEMGFEASRVVAIGYGESEQIDDHNLPDYQIANRRIVLRVNVHIAPNH